MAIYNSILNLAMKIFCLFFFFSFSCFAQTTLPYKNKLLPVDERVNDLLSRMTAEEKFWQLFMIPGEVKKGDEEKYKNGIFGFQISAVAPTKDATAPTESH